MNIHNFPVGSNGKSWQIVKGELIARHGSIKTVAALLDCHPNSLRAAVEGTCPGVCERLEALLARQEQEPPELRATSKD